MEADRSLQGKHVVAALTRAILERGQAPRSITLDNGSEFTGRALEAWAMQRNHPGDYRVDGLKSELRVYFAILAA
jgi:putative transposase